MPLFLHILCRSLVRSAALLALAAVCAALLPHAPAEAAGLNAEAAASVALPGAERLRAAPFAVFGGGTDDLQADAPDGGMLDGSFLGALLLGNTFTGIGTADIALLAALAAVGILLLRRKPSGRDDGRFTVDRNKPAGGEEDRLSPPLRRSRNLKDYRPSATRPENGGGPAPRPSGPARDNDPQADLKRNAAAHWAHFSSRQKAHMPGESRASVGPAGFDTEDFLEGARMLYVRLQQGWAARDVGDLAPFVTERMFRTLQKQAELDPTPSPVAVLLVNAEFGDLDKTGEEERASVHFSALLETEGGKKNEVRELWRFVRGAENGATWRLAGIEPGA